MRERPKLKTYEHFELMNNMRPEDQRKETIEKDARKAKSKNNQTSQRKTKANKERHTDLCRKYEGTALLHLFGDFEKVAAVPSLLLNGVGQSPGHLQICEKMPCRLYI